MAPHPLLAPILVLAAWTMVMWTWMYATRLPAIRRSRMKLDPHAPRGEQMGSLPAPVRWKADNHNNLMEQPTVFYAVAIALVLLGARGSAPVVLAWSYVGLRVAHSVVQAGWNKVELRFSLFFLASLALVGMIVCGLVALRVG